MTAATTNREFLDKMLLISVPPKIKLPKYPDSPGFLDRYSTLSPAALTTASKSLKSEQQLSRHMQNSLANSPQSAKTAL